MKHLKKIVSLLLTAVMVLAMCIPVMAANVDITNHKFEAYQIFIGDLDGKKLSNIKWGDGVKASELLAETALAGCTTPTEVAEKLIGESPEISSDVFIELVSNHLTDTKTSGTGSIALPAAGYYLIEDITNVQSQPDAKNLTLLKVSAAETVTPQVKTDKPTLEKKVKDTNDSAGTTTDWQDSADYDIGDTIPYQLTATMGNISNYDTYYVKFWDTMTHLTYTGITSVKVGSTPLAADKYTVNWDSNAKELTVEIDDVKQYGATEGTKVVVEYTATLDANAVIGSTGNPNEAHLQYSNNPNNAGSGETGNTPNDKNIVFTYKVVANKVDENKNPLTGAAFELQKKDKDGNYKTVSICNATKKSDGTYELTDNARTSFEWNGIDDGVYKIIEVITPAGYNSINPIEFTVRADHEILSDNPQLKELLGGDAFSGEASTGTLTTAIENKSGSSLPETGGIGTTIFYVVGVILMLGAGVLLVTKKRMSSNR